MVNERLKAIEEHFASGDFVAALEAAQGALSDLRRDLSGTDYVRLYKLVGNCARRLGQVPAALRALREAHRRDPLDKDVMVSLSETLFEDGQRDEAAQVVESLLIQHGRSLPARTHVTALCMLGEYFLEQKKPRSAWKKLRKAWKLDDSRIATGLWLLQSLEQLEDQEEVFRLRAKLLDRTADALTKSRLLRAHAASLLERGDEAPALNCMKEAYLLDPQEELFEELAGQLEATGQFEELAAVIGRRAESTDGEEFARLVERLFDLFTSHIGDSERAAQALELLLDRDPLSLQPFERLTQLHYDGETWPQLHDAYARMIKRTMVAQPQNGPLLGLLWKNLAELCRTQLSELEAAKYAFEMSFQYVDDPATQEIIIDLSSQVGTPDEQLETLARAFARQSGRLDIAERYGAALLKNGKLDHGAVILQSVVARGGGSPRAREIVSGLASQRKARFGTPLTDTVRGTYMRPPQVQPLDHVLSVAYAALVDYFARDMDYYSLRRKDQLSPKDDLLFNRVLDELREDLNIEHRPYIYVSDEVENMENAGFGDISFVVPNAMLSGRAERELRFIVGQKLTMSQSRNQFAGLLQPQQLKAVVGCMINFVRPEFPVSDGEEFVQIKKMLSKNVQAEWRYSLKEAVNAMFDNEALADVDAWLEVVAAEANYTGLLCCDDLASALSALSGSPATPGPRNLDFRRDLLVRWAVSDSHLGARQAVGIALD